MRILIVDGAGGSGSITVTISDKAGGRAEIAIRDTGEGFDPGNAPVLFQHGFSTRKHKSGGLGLHWCANSVAAIHGSLRLEIDGVGGAPWRGWCCAPMAESMPKTASAQDQPRNFTQRVDDGGFATSSSHSSREIDPRTAYCGLTGMSASTVVDP